MNRRHASAARKVRAALPPSGVRSTRIDGRLPGAAPGAPASARRLALLVALVLGLCAGAGAAWAAGSPAASGVMVNLNTATVEELQALPGIGASRAAQIVALRAERGAFRSVDELLEVRGIGPAMLERLRPQVALSGQTRLAPTPTRGSASSRGGSSSTGAAPASRKDGR